MSVLWLDVILIVLVVLVSYILHRRIALHRIAIGRVSLGAIHDVHYSGSLHGDTFPFDFICSRIAFKPHWPTKKHPRWLTVTVCDVLYKSGTCDVSIKSLSVTCWFFPMLFRQTAGPWVNAEVDDLRIRIMRSNQTPSYVKVMRENLVGAIMNGDILRVDDFGTTVRFSGLTECDVEERVDIDGHGSGADKMPDGGCYNDELNDGHAHGHEEMIHDSIGGSNGFLTNNCKPTSKHLPAPFLTTDQDETRISAFARGLHFCNKEGRHYSFDKVDAQLRRNWTANRGTFVMIAKECRWIRVPWPYQLQAASSWWSYVYISPLLAFDVSHVLTRCSLAASSSRPSRIFRTTSSMCFSIR